jgi:gas vesicle protein
MSNNRSSGLFVGGLLVGAAVGTITGLLVAPRSGRETRSFLRKSADALPELAEDLSFSLQLQADRLSESALRNWDETLLRLQDAIAAGIEASQQDRQQLQQAKAEAKSSLSRQGGRGWGIRSQTDSAESR